MRLNPYYEHAGITIYHGDCREILPGLGRCDLLCTDPPYGVNLGDHAGAQDNRLGALTKSHYASYDDTPENYLASVVPAITAALSLSTRGMVFGVPPTMREATEPPCDPAESTFENVRGAQPWVGRIWWACTCCCMGRAFPTQDKADSHGERRADIAEAKMVFADPDWPHNWMLWAGSKAAKIPAFLARHIAKCFKPISSPV